MDLQLELAQNQRFASLQAAADAEGARRQREAAERSALAEFDRELAAAGWSDAYDRVSGHVYYYHIDGRTTWDNPLQSVADQSPNAPAATGDVDETITASSSPASIKRHVEARIAARHQERAAALALVAVVHESPEVASKLISLQKGRAARGRRNTRPTRRLAQRRTPGAANSLQHQHQHQRLKVEEVETQEQDMESGGRGWGVGLDGILEASVGLDGSIDQLAFDEMVESAEKQDSEARTPRTPAGRPADGNCPAPPATPPPASDSHAAAGELASLVLSAQRADGTIDIGQLDRSIALEESEEEQRRGAHTQEQPVGDQPHHGCRDLETLRLSVLGKIQPQPEGCLASSSGSGGDSGGGDNTLRSGTFAPYPTSRQTAELAPLQEKNTNTHTATSKPPPQKQRHGHDNGAGGKLRGGCCGSRPR